MIKLKHYCMSSQTTMDIDVRIQNNNDIINGNAIYNFLMRQTTLLNIKIDGTENRHEYIKNMVKNIKGDQLRNIIKKRMALDQNEGNTLLGQSNEINRAPKWLNGKKCANLEVNLRHAFLLEILSHLKKNGKHAICYFIL